MEKETADILIAVVSTIGGGAIVLAVLQRYWKKRDQRIKVLESNEGKLIDADQLALKMLYEDVTKLKAEVKELRKELSDVKDERSELRAENKILSTNEKHMKERIDRQGERIRKLEEDLTLTKDLLTEGKVAIKHRDTEISALRSELNYTVIELNKLKADHFSTVGE